MHIGALSHLLQLGAPSPRSIQVWSSSIPGGLLLLDAGRWTADDTAAAGDGSAKPAGSGGGLESGTYYERFV